MRGMIHALLALSLGAASAVAHAQAWPTKPIRLIVPYAVGQGTDIAGRFIVEEMGKELKQAFVV
jgi:tripartite-type tricarboxylate transporter receptor subunit TctC